MRVLIWNWPICYPGYVSWFLLLYLQYIPIVFLTMSIECTLVHEEITLKRDSFRNETSISMIKQFRIQQSNWLPFYSLNDKMRYSVLWTIYHSNSIWSQIWMTDIYYKLKLFFAYNPCWHTFSSHSISVYLTCNFTYKCK